MTTYNVEIVVNGRDNASAPLGRVGGALGNIAQITAGILGADMLKGIASGLANITQEALQSYAAYERLGMALQSLTARELLNTGQAGNMTQAMGLAADKSQELLKWIEKLAIQSPFNQEDVAGAFRLSMAYGFTTDEAKRLTGAMIDFAAGSGASGYSMQMISLALGQIKAKGKLAGQEVLQLTNAGLDVRGILAESFGVTTEELIRMQERGLIPANEAIEAIVSTLERDFGGAAKAQAGTFSGLLASLEDIKSVGLREFFEGTFKSVQPYLQKFVDTLSSEEFMNSLNKLGQGLGKTVSNVMEFVASLQGVASAIMHVFTSLTTGNFEVFAQKVSNAIWEIGSRLGFTNDQIAGVISGWLKLRTALQQGFGKINLLEMLTGGAGLLAGGGLAAAFGPLAAIGGQFGLTIAAGVGGALTAKLGAFVVPALTKTLVGNPALSGLLVKIFGSILGVGKLAGLMTPLAGLVTLGGPILLVATAVMTLVGAFQLLQSGKLLPMLEPLKGSFQQIGETAARIIPVLQKVGQQIWDSLVKNSEQLASQVIPWMVSSFQKLGDWFSENEPLIKKFIETIGGFISNWLLPAIAGAWQVLEPLLTGIIDLFLGLVTLIMQVLTGDWAGAWETLKQIAVNVLEALGQAVLGLLNWIANMMGTNLTELGNTLSMLGAIIANWWGNLGNTLNMLGSIIANWWAGLGNTIMMLGAIISAWWSGLGTTAMQALAIVSSAISTWASGLGTTLMQLFTIVSAGVMEWITGVGTTATQLFAIVSYGVSDAFQKIVGLISAAKSSIQSAWANIVIVVQTFMQNLVGTISGFFVQFMQLGGEMIQNLYQGASDVLGGLWGSFADIGSSIVSGVQSGVEGAWSTFVGWFQGLIDDLLSNIMNSLGIHSPSTVFAGIGANMMAGLGAGVGEAAAIPQTALMNTTDDLIGAAKNQAARFGNAVTNNQTQTNYFGPVTVVSGKSDRGDQDMLKAMR
jgi:tape measure domain-containing protein